MSTNHGEVKRDATSPNDINQQMTVALHGQMPMTDSGRTPSTSMIQPGFACLPKEISQKESTSYPVLATGKGGKSVS